MPLLDNLLARLQRHPKRIVFVEGEDPRIMQTARQLATRRCAVPILLGDRAVIKDIALRLDVRLDGIRIMEPSRSDDIDLFLPMTDAQPRFADLSIDEKRTLVLDRHNFAAFMLVSGRADALIGGATHAPSSGFRSLLRIVPRLQGVRTISSMLILDQDDNRFGFDGTLFLADCGIVPEPDADQLADIAVTTADLAAHLTGQRPRVAMLSFSTRSATPAHHSIGRIREAILLARQKAHVLGLDADFEGEMQLDAALDPVAARNKGLPDSPVAGAANVLIFPDLNSGNITAKTLQVLARARIYGPIITGLARPCGEIGRGAHAYDVFGTAVITACRAIDRNLLCGSAG
jgi:phosphate acetyltransferase